MTNMLDMKTRDRIIDNNGWTGILVGTPFDGKIKVLYDHIHGVWEGDINDLRLIVSPGPLTVPLSSE